MQKELATAIDGLYTTFAPYPLRAVMEGCPCCVSQTDKEKIHVKQLRQLTGEDLDRYAFKAMTTWGDVADFKHFFPRIAELLSTRELGINAFVVFGKLIYGHWRDWPQNEQATVEAFCYAWWANHLKEDGYFDKSTFISLYQTTQNLPKLLDSWAIDLDSGAFNAYVDLVNDYVLGLPENKAFKHLSQEDMNCLVTWLKANAGHLEAGFFYFEQKDPVFAARISTALHWLELQGL